MHIHIGHNFFGAGNFGDDLMLAGFLAGIGTPPGLKLTGMTSYDIESQRRRFPQIDWAPYTSAAREALIAECDVWLGLGGAVLQPHNDSWLLADQVTQLQECRRRGKPVFFLGCGIDYRQDAARPEIRLLLDSARWIWPREALSSTALRQMGFARETAAADMSHLALRAMALPGRPIEAESTGFVCNFELSSQYTMEHLAGLITATAEVGQTVQWLVQEVRPLPGSEHDLRDRMPADVRSLLQLREPDYATADMTGLIRSWGVPARIFTTRFHGAIVGGWLGSRVVAFERQQKLCGIAQALGITAFTTLPDAVQLAQAFERSQPVARSILDRNADLAQQACTAFMTAATEFAPIQVAVPAQTFGENKPMTTTPARIERHSVTGIAEVGLDRIGPGLKRGEIFVVRNCLQAVGALDTLRAMILEVLEEVAGPTARAKAVSQGLTRLHEFVPIDQLMQMNPLMKRRAKPLAAKIVDDLNTKLLGLGPNVHFEDTPNVRIFIPHDVSSAHDAALRTYARNRGSGGELTLHPPHQDSRHFHPTGAINIWCAIDSVVEANGMVVYPDFYGHHLPYTKADGGVAPGQYLGRPVTMDLASGDAWIFETLHLHASTINQTDRTRFVISFRITPDVPSYPVKPWYNYVRPADCPGGEPPPNRVDYAAGLPDRGPVTLDTSTRIPPAVVSSTRPNGAIEVPSGMVPEGEIRPVNEDLCIARIGGKPVTFFRGCPHEGADLAGGTIRDGQIMCPWHGLRMNATDGRSGCQSLHALEFMPCTERDGTIVIAAQSAEDPQPEPIPVDEHGAAIDHFTAAADQFVALFETYRPTPDRYQSEHLSRMRDSAVYALLGLPGTVIRTRLEAPVLRLFGAIRDSGVQNRIRTPEQQATFAECCRRLGQSWDNDAGYVYGLAALALCWHGFELVGIRPLARDLGWAEPLWLQALLASPPAFLRPGDAERFADALAPLMEQVEERLALTPPASRAALITALLPSDLFVQGYFNDKNMRPAMRARGRAIERFMTLEGARLDQLVVRRPSRRQPRVGFITIGVQDRAESVFLLSHMEHLGRLGFDVRLYCRMDPEGRIGGLCRNAAARYVRLPDSILVATDYLRREDLDIAIFAGNLAAVVNAPTMYAAQRIARIQASATWTPLTSGLRNVDVMISSEYGELHGAEAHYTEQLVRLPGAHTCFPFERMLEGQRAATAPSRAELNIPEEVPVYVSAAFSSKITPELSRAWAEIMKQVPDAHLILLPFNPNWSKRYDTQSLLRRIAEQWHEVGLPLDRLHIQSTLPNVADLHLVLGLADIYLDSFPYSGASSIYDPIVVGLPIVARAGETCRSRQSYAMLRDIGLEDWVAASEAEYIDRAVRLGRDPDYLSADAVRLSEATAVPPPFVDTVRYADKLAHALTGLVAAWDRRTVELQAMPEAMRVERITTLAAQLGRERGHFAKRDVLEEIVLPYLRHGDRRHFIHVGGNFEATGRMLLAESWMGILFGPDGRPAPQPGKATAENADIGIAALIEQAQFNDADLVLIDAAGNDFTILSALNFGGMSAGLLMASFDTALPGQNAASTERLLAGMRLNGYRSAGFGFAVDAATGRSKLTGIAVDSLPPRSAAGVLLFFRMADDAFLPSLLGWLEDVTKETASGLPVPGHPGVLPQEFKAAE